MMRKKSHIWWYARGWAGISLPMPLVYAGIRMDHGHSVALNWTVGIYLAGMLLCVIMFNYLQNGDPFDCVDHDS